MDGEVPGILWYALAVGFVVFAIIVPLYWGLWGMHRTNTRTLEVLRIYAERGEEPPPGVLAALPMPQQGAGRTPAAPRLGRSAHLEQFVYSAGMAAAAAGIAWWRIADGGGPQWVVYAAVIAAVVMGAGALARLVAALSTPPQ